MQSLAEVPQVRTWCLRPASGQAKRDFLSLHDLSIEEFESLLCFAADVKRYPEAYSNALDGCSAALIFEKPSLRTRVTFEVGMSQLGGSAVYLAPEDIGLGQREAVQDVARNLARWVDVLVARVFGHEVLQIMAHEAHVPVINALSDLLHPCQAVADALTLRELRGSLRGFRLAYVGDGNNVALALSQAAAKTGMHFTMAVPRGREPSATFFAEAREDAARSGARLLVVYEPDDAVFEADAVYTDVWASMGQEHQAEERRKTFARYQVNARLMSLARPDALFLHCLPAHRGEEVADEVLDGPHSAVLEQAENRLHVHKALLLALLAGEESPGRPKKRR